MPKTKDAFAFRDFDSERILQRKFFCKLNLPVCTDAEFFNRYHVRFTRRSFESSDSSYTSLIFSNRFEALRKLNSALARYMQLHILHCKKLDSLKSKYAENFMSTPDDFFKENFNRANRLLDFYLSLTAITADLMRKVLSILRTTSKVYQYLWRKEFGERLRDARLAKGLTQAQLAELIGSVSRDAIQRYESGGADIALPNLYKLAKILGVSADSLLGLK